MTIYDYAQNQKELAMAIEQNDAAEIAMLLMKRFRALSNEGGSESPVCGAISDSFRECRMNIDRDLEEYSETQSSNRS